LGSHPGAQDTFDPRCFDPPVRIHIEAVWKAAQLHLRITENLALASPTAVARACFQAALLDEEQSRIAMDMVRDRNLTVHTYNEELADQIYSRLHG
jgi:hypothetical protein